MGLDDKIKSAAQKVAGKAEEAFGHLTNDDAEVAKGKKDQAAADVKDGVEHVKDEFKH